MTQTEKTLVSELMRLILTLILSLKIHFLLIWLSARIPSPDAFNQQAQIEIELLKPSTNKPGQVVRQTEVPKHLVRKTLEDKVALLSERSQRVAEQTRAALSGQTANRSQNSNKRAIELPRPQQNKKDFDPFAEMSRSNLPRGQDARMPSFDQLNPGISTVGEALPNEISIGQFTALNTDRYLFYSFFARIEDLIRYRWEASVRLALQNSRRSQFGVGQKAWVTQLEIELSPEGHFKAANILKPSGIRSFDQAAASSFAQAKFFPNPPKEMVEDDGVIRLKYAFEVQVDPRLVARP